MPDKLPELETYLEEIGHFLSGRDEREEILSEIRSHILEKAATEQGGIGEDALGRAIAAYGPPRRVAERYAEDRPIIAPAYKRFLFRYTSILFTVHLLLTVVAVAFTKSFIVFPFLYVPEMSVIDALMYLPTAFLADLGVVTLILYFITQSGKDVKLPWPKIGADLDEIVSKKSPVRRRLATAVGLTVMAALTGFAVYLYVRFQTIFFVFHSAADFPRDPMPLFTPGAGRRLSLIVIAMFAASAAALLVKLFTRSRGIDAVSNIVSLALIGLILRQPFDDLFAVPIAERLLPLIKQSITIALLFIAVMVTIDLVKNLVAVGRSRLRP